MRAIILALVLLACLAEARHGQRLFREMARYQIPSGAVQATGFITTWAVTNGGSITLPLRSGYTYDMSVDYGDGTVVNVNSNNDPDATHQYTSGDSNRTVTITGTMGAWYFNNGGSRANFRGVTLWEPVGGVGASGLAAAFYGCTAATNFGPIGASWLPVNTLASTWYYCSDIKNGFPEVNMLTDVNTLASTWYYCSGNTNAFPAVSNIVKATTLQETWYNCSGIKNGFPEVNTLTNVTTLLQTWYGCSGNTNVFPAVSNLKKVTSFSATWQNCSASYFNLQDVLGDCSWITGQVKTVANAFNGNIRMTGNGMPLVTAITNSPGYPTGYTITDCFQNCTNLTDWAIIPEAFK